MRDDNSAGLGKIRLGRRCTRRLKEQKIFRVVVGRQCCAKPGKAPVADAPAGSASVCPLNSKQQKAAPCEAAS